MHLFKSQLFSASLQLVAKVVINLACCCHFLRIHYLSPSANQSANTA
ncbi:hypothetical protein DAI22_06g062100 [Oryza sativa Japonica Group]|nr:hypothetical protein DAI22_06g062100 [Oryza sativa Japonica Group]